MMKRHDRQQEILEMVRHAEQLAINDLAERLRVSEETVRRELRQMEADGLVKRLHGGVRLAVGFEEGPFETRLKRNAEAKKRIAAAVAGVLPDGASVYLDASSTCFYVAQALRDRRDLTIITNAIGVAQELAGRNGNRVYFAGGEIDYAYRATFDESALRYLLSFRPDMAVVSTESIELATGFGNYHVGEALLCRQMIALSGCCFMAVDSSKFGRRSFAHVANFDEVARVFTDAFPGDDYRAVLSSVELTIC